MQDLIRDIKKIMTDVAVGNEMIDDKNQEYQDLYQMLDEEYQRRGIPNPNEFTDLWEFHHYWKEHLDSYSSRRDFVIKLYKPSRINHSPNWDFWSLIHQSIISVAKSRFDSGHHADAVEAAMKEVNVRVKQIYKNISGSEDDGASLMKNAFSVRNPRIVLGDISTESGKNIQQGYMEIFSGAMMGIRNPKAHENITISKDRAIHFLFLASLLMNKIDEAGY